MGQFSMPEECMKRQLSKNGIALLLAVGMVSGSQAAPGPVTGASGTHLDTLTTVNFNEVWSDDVLPTYHLYDQYFLPQVAGTQNLLVDGIKSSGDTIVLDDQVGDGSVLNYVTSTSLTSGWDATAVSAIYNTYKVVGYFRDNFSRSGLDGSSMNNLAVIGHSGSSNIAEWNGAFMLYGDGDGVNYSSMAGCLDLAATAMSDAVVEHSANLKSEFQSGALRVAFGDIFAAMIDDGDWTIGEDCKLTGNGYDRSLDDPGQSTPPQAYHMDNYEDVPFSNDDGGVTFNAGIPARVAYLLAEGLTTEGLGTKIGRVETATIFYRALTKYLSPSANFLAAREATESAASELYGNTSAELTAVRLAWDAVGVKGTFALPADQTPVSVSLQAGTDVMVYLRSGVGGALYMQTVQTDGSPFSGYNIANDISLGVNANRAGAVTIATPPTTTTLVYYLGTDSNLYVIDTNTNAVSTLISTGNITKFAVSPQNQYLAYVKSDATNKLYVSTAPGNPTNNVTTHEETQTFADKVEIGSLAFNYSGDKVVYDVTLCKSGVNGDCNAAGGYRYQTVWIRDLRNGQIDKLFPTQHPGIEIANVSFAYNNDDILVMDYIDRTNEASGTVVSKVVTFNTRTQNLDKVDKFQTIGTPITDVTASYGYPAFWPDDTYITKQEGGVTVRVPVNADGSPGSGATDTLNTNAAYLPAMHRKVTRDVTPVLESDKTELGLGAILLQESATGTITLTNSGPVDIDIQRFALDTNAFTHNGLPTLLPQGQSLALTVSYQAGNEVLTDTGTLTVEYNRGQTLEIPLSVSVITPANLVTDKSLIDFGEVEFGQTQDVSWIVNNAGLEPAVISSIVSTNPAFIVDNANSFPEIINGQQAVYTIKYTAADTTQTDHGSIVIRYTGGVGSTEQMLILSLVATSVPPPTPALLQADIADVDFGQVNAWDIATASVVLTNTGETGAVISDITTSNEQFFGALPIDQFIAIPSGGSYSFDISFSANGTASVQSGTLTLTYGGVAPLAINVTAETLAEETRKKGDNNGGLGAFNWMLFVLLPLFVRRRLT